MTHERRDRYTGHRMTDHEWNGIRELNTRIPRLQLWCLAIAFLYSVVSWMLLPAWPSVESYSRGWLSVDQKTELQKTIAISALASEDTREAFMGAGYDEILDNPEWVEHVTSGGEALYGDNCMGCHGREGEGNKSFPRLNDDQWLWPNDPGSILQTLQFGINSGHPDTRISQMPSFGQTGVLNAAEIRDVAQYVRSLSQPSLGDGAVLDRTLSINRGKKLYQLNCPACHGSGGAGNPILGAPNLVDQQWLYGGSLDDIFATLENGRKGQMPAWIDRLNEYEIKLLTSYVLLLSDTMSTALVEQPE